MKNISLQYQIYDRMLKDRCSIRNVTINFVLNVERISDGQAHPCVHSCGSKIITHESAYSSVINILIAFALVYLYIRYKL